MTAIDIVIPCAGRAPDLMRLLTALHTQCADSMAGLCASITVTDDRHSTALAAQIAASFGTVRYVAGPARGPAANRNHGASFGQADWLLFLDDDCFPQADLLRAYADRVEGEPQAEVVEGAIHAVGDRPNGNHHAPLNTSGGVLWSCNLMLHRSLFDAIGRFDEAFPYACLEDSDLARRLQQRPARIVFAEGAVVFHPWRSVSEREISRAIISHAIYASKHPDFVRDWGLWHLLRAMRGRVRQYRLGRFSSIPSGKYRTVLYDLMAPLIVCAVVRIVPLRRALCERYQNRWPVGA